MRLPKIQENENSLKTDYFKAIMTKPVSKAKAEKVIFDWQNAEVSLISYLPDSQTILNPLLQMQKLSLKDQIPHFFTYFFVKNLISSAQNEQKAMINNIDSFNNLIKDKSTHYHKIITLIKLRENLISKLSKADEKNEKQKKHEYLDDVRFVNFEIVKKINSWKQLYKSEDSPIFIVDGNNYLIKMINDNATILKNLNEKRVMYLSPPNPFFLTCDGNKTSMSHTQQQDIEECMQIMAQEKAQELRFMIDPPKFVSRSKNETDELKNLKSQLEIEKNEKIKSIYKSNSSSSFYSTKMRKSAVGISQDKSEKKNKSGFKFEKTNKNLNQSGNKLQKLIQEKQVKTIQQVKTSRVRDNSQNSSKKNLNPYQQKIASLKAQVQKPKLNKQKEKQKQKNEALMKLSTISMKSKLPKNVSQVKQPKPKIKLIMEKDTIVEDTIKAILPSKDLEMYNSTQVRKSTSSFFKPFDKIPEKKEQEQFDHKPITLENERRKSAVNISSNKFLNAQDKKELKNTKYHLQTMRKSVNVLKQEKKNKSLSKSKSKSRSKIEKEFRNTMRKQKTLEELERDKVDQELRVVRNRLKDLTVQQIYENKMKMKKTANSPYSPIKGGRSPSKTQQSMVSERSLHERQQQLRKLKSELKEKNIRSIYSFREKQPSYEQSGKVSQLNEKAKMNKSKEKFRNTKKETKKNKFYSSSFKLKQKEEEIKNQNKAKKQEIELKQTQKEQLLKDLAEKDKRIGSLLQILKKEESKDENQNKEDAKEMEEFKKQKQQKMKEIQGLRTKLSIESKFIEEQMQQQEKRYISLKEEQFKMKEEQVLKKYAKDMNEMKEEYMKKNKELQEKIIEEEKIRKEQELKLLKEQREMQELKLELEEKNLKQKLLQEVMEEQRRKEKMQEEKQKVDDQLRKQRLKIELLQNEEVQRKIIQNIQQDNKKLVSLFEVMKKKNEAIEDENRIKLKEIQEMEEKLKEQEKNLKEIQESLWHNSRVNEESNNKNEQSVQNKEKEEEQEQQLQDIQALKLRVKQQILQEMMVRKKQEEEQNRMYELERKRKIQELQQQIKKTLREQQEQIERKQQEEKERILKQKQQERKKEEQRIHSQQYQKYQQELKKVTLENQKREEQQRQKEQQQERQREREEAQRLQKQKEKQIEKQRQIQKENQRQRQRQENGKDSEDGEKEQEKGQKNEEGIKQEQSKQKVKVQNEQQQEESREEDDNKQVNQDSGKQQKQQMQEQKQQKKEDQQQNKQQQKGQQQQMQQKKEEKQQQNKQEEKEKEDKPQQQHKNEDKKEQQTSPIKGQPKKAMKQETQEVLNKYQQLQQYIQPKCKQIYIYDNILQNYIETFYNSFSSEVKQMIPYQKKQIYDIAINSNKKVDIFDCHSIGWKQAQKYILIGDLGCVEIIAKKYGNIQIQTLYIFNKTSPYQKQYLAKQIKIYDKIGYIFQKKLKQQNMYSIKLILKIPAEILPKNHKPISSNISMTNRVVIQNNNHEQKTKKYSLSYALSQTLKNNLNGEEQLQYKASTHHDEKSIINKMHLGLVNNPMFTTLEIDDRKLQTVFKTHLNYIQTQQHPCYVFNSVQHRALNEEYKFYTIKLSDTMSIAIFQEKVQEEYNVDFFLDINSKKMEKERDLLICVPIWSGNHTLKLSSPGPKKFTYTHQVQANLNYGSVINTNIQKEGLKFIRTPFVFSVFESNINGLLLRPLFGQVVQKSQVVYMKR